MSTMQRTKSNKSCRDTEHQSNDSDAAVTVAGGKNRELSVQEQSTANSRRSSRIQPDDRLHRKREREKQRRHRTKESYDRLVAMLVRVDPNFRSQLEARKGLPNASSCSSQSNNSSNKDDNDNDHDNDNKEEDDLQGGEGVRAVFSRIELVDQATVALGRLQDKLDFHMEKTKTTTKPSAATQVMSRDEKDEWSGDRNKLEQMLLLSLKKEKKNLASRSPPIIESSSGLLSSRMTMMMMNRIMGEMDPLASSSLQSDMMVAQLNRPHATNPRMMSTQPPVGVMPQTPLQMEFVLQPVDGTTGLIRTTSLGGSRSNMLPSFTPSNPTLSAAGQPSSLEDTDILTNPIVVATATQPQVDPAELLLQELAASRLPIDNSKRPVVVSSSSSGTGGRRRKKARFH